METTLYCKDAGGRIRFWKIEALDDGISMTYGLADGAVSNQFEEVRVGKGGRTREGQIYSRYLSRINRQTDKGYVHNVLDAENNKRTNSLGLIRPMLAQPIKNIKSINYHDAHYQHKYDGNRCLVTNRGGENIAYSRNGKMIVSISHILDSMILPDGCTIDGELYCHGVSLQQIGSWIKRDQEATINLSLRVYDIIRNEPYSSRLARLRGLTLGDNASIVPTVLVENERALSELFEDSISSGYEGGIVRMGKAGYEDGKRSKSLLKMKVFDDDEFLVVDIIESKEGWARLRLKTKKGIEFGASAPGSMDNKYEIAENKDDYIGRMVNVKYMGYTKDGKPFHPTAVAFRQKEAE